MTDDPSTSSGQAGDMIEKSVLYIAPIFGNPPFNYLKKYLEENNLAKITVIHFPQVRLTKGRLFADAWILDEGGHKFSGNVNLPFHFPIIFVYAAHYVIYFFLLFRLLGKIQRKKFNLGMGESTFNGFLIFLLKKLGRVEFAVFMNGDVLPEHSVNQRAFLKGSGFFIRGADWALVQFQSFLRSLAYHCDLISYPTAGTKKADEDRGWDHKKSIVSSWGVVDVEEVKKNLENSRSKNALVYMGQLSENAGLDLLLRSLKLIVDQISLIQLIIVGGGGRDVEKYQKTAAGLGVSDHVKFHGYVPDRDEAFKIISQGVLAVALYKPSSDNVSLFTEPSKVKQYIGAGLPVVINRDGPPLVKDFEKFGGAVFCDFNEQNVAQEIVKTLSDDQSIAKLREGVLKFAQFYDYRERFKSFWNQILVKG